MTFDIRLDFTKVQRHYVIVSIALLISPLFAAAADFDLKISEIMYDPAGKEAWGDTSYTRDWIEITNIGDESMILDENWRFCRLQDCEKGYFRQLKAWQGMNGDLILAPGESMVIADYPEAFLSNYPGFTGTILDSVVKLVSGPDTIKIVRKANEVWGDIDILSYSDSWGAKDNGFSLEKIDLGGANDYSNWSQSQIEGGTPGQINYQFIVSNPQLPIDKTPTAATQSSTPPENSAEPISAEPEYQKDVLINEFLPDPVGSDLEAEWIEIQNSGEGFVDLSGWQLDDSEEGSRFYAIPSGVFISPRSYLVFSRPTTGIAVNNAGDSVRLIWPNGKVADSASFSEKAPEGQSYNRLETMQQRDDGTKDIKERVIEWRWSETLTPGSANIVKAADEVKTAEKVIGATQNGTKTENSISTDNIGQKPDRTNQFGEETEKTRDNGFMAGELPHKNLSASSDIAISPIFVQYLLPIVIAFTSGFLIFLLRKKIF